MDRVVEGRRQRREGAREVEESGGGGGGGGASPSSTSSVVFLVLCRTDGDNADLEASASTAEADDGASCLAFVLSSSSSPHPTSWMGARPSFGSFFFGAGVVDRCVSCDDVEEGLREEDGDDTREAYRKGNAFRGRGV